MIPNAATVRGLARTALLRRARVLELPEGQPDIIVLAPHPDDETLGCGALIMRTLGNGGRVSIVVATDGAESHAGQDVDRAKLIELRHRELLEAGARLGLVESDVVVLGFGDGTLNEHLDKLTSDLAEVVAGQPAAAVFVTCAEESNPDHAALATAAATAVHRSRGTAAMLWEYPIWLWSDWPISRRFRIAGLRRLLSLWFRAAVSTVAVTPYAAEKAHAVRAYRSQLGEAVPAAADRAGPGPVDLLPGVVALPEVVLERALNGPELFLRRDLRQRPASSRMS
jgi:LmbE family N-acetylglucosaminyl deacetylase